MKSKSLLILGLFMSSLSQVIAQLKITDLETKEAIPFVEIYSSKGQLVGLSNANGLVNERIISIIKQSSEADIFTFNHMAYEESIFQKNDLLNATEIKLKYKSWALDEVIVKAKKQKYYVKLVGFYRSYQSNDNELRYYVDGQVEILFSPNQKKTPQNKRLEERYFTTPKYLEPEKGQHIIINTVGPKMPDTRGEIAEIEKEFNVSKEETGQYILTSKKSKAKVGFISKNSQNNTILYDIGYVTPDNPEKYNALGQQTVIENRNEFSVFKNTENGKINIADLLYFKYLIKLKTKHKDDVNYQNVESVSEFYTTNIEYLEAKPNGFSNFTGVKKHSNYNTHFWKEMNKHPLFQNLPKGVANTIKQNLSELTNIRKEQ